MLVSGKGTRFILANTEQLHSKIQEMSDRIRSLEEGLQALHAEHSHDSDEPHPLMRADLLGIKSTMGLYSGTQVNSSDTGTKHSEGAASKSSPMDTDRPAVERGTSEDTVTVMSDHHSHSHLTKVGAAHCNICRPFLVTDTLHSGPDRRDIGGLFCSRDCSPEP